MRKQFISFIALFLVVTLGIAGCGNGEQSGDKEGPIQIAVAGPMTGNGAEYGQAFKEGAKLAVSQFNENGGYKGRKVKLVFGDDKNSPKEAANVAQKLASNEEIKAVIGHWSSSATYAGIPIYNRNQIPMITPTASDPGITQPDTKWIFRSSTTQILEGKNLADFAVNQLGKKKIAILYLNSDWGEANASNFKKFAQKFGADITVYESYPPGQGIDYTAALTKIKQTHPDLLYLGSLYSEGILIIKQAKKMGIKADFMGSTTFNSAGFLKAGDVVEGVYLDSLFYRKADNKLVQQFVKDFKNKFGKKPGYFNALAYDATTIVLEALKNGGPTREGIRDAMAKIDGLPVVTGTVKFNEERSDTNKRYYNLVVKNGKFVLAKKAKSQ